MPQLNSAAVEARLRQRQLLLERAAYVTRSSFYAYVRAMAPLIVPTFIDGKHIKLVCDEVQKAVETPGGRLMVFAPPGSMKSKIISVLLPTWLFGRDPDSRFIGIAHSDRLIETFGYEARNLIDAPEYKAVFPNVQVSSDRRASTRWQLAGSLGMYFGAGVGTNIAGFRANVAVLDDALSEQTAFNANERGRVNDWFVPGLTTRLLPGGSIIIVNTRYHVDDLSGYLLKAAKENPKADQWRVISIPAILDEGAAAMLDLPVGGSYWPEMWPIDELLKKRENHLVRDGERFWSALYMQRPVVEGGNIYKEAWFKIWELEEPPRCQLIIQTLDTAFGTSHDSAESVIQTWGLFLRKVHNGDEVDEEIPSLILLDMKHGKLEYHQLRQLAKERYEKWKPSRIIIENRASGQSLIQDLQRAHLPVQAWRPDRDKISRAHVASGLVEAGRVWLPPQNRFKWSRALVEQATTFSGIVNEPSDMVDAMAMAILWMQENFQVRNAHDKPQLRSERPPPKPSTYWSAVAQHKKA